MSPLDDCRALTPSVPNLGCSSSPGPELQLTVLSMFTGTGEWRRNTTEDPSTSDRRADAPLYLLPASLALLELLLLSSSLLVP